MENHKLIESLVLLNNVILTLVLGVPDLWGHRSRPYGGTHTYENNHNFTLKFCA